MTWSVFMDSSITATGPPAASYCEPTSNTRARFFLSRPAGSVGALPNPSGWESWSKIDSRRVASIESGIQTPPSPPGFGLVVYGLPAQSR